MANPIPNLFVGITVHDSGSSFPTLFNNSVDAMTFVTNMVTDYEWVVEGYVMHAYYGIVMDHWNARNDLAIFSIVKGEGHKEQ